MKKTVFVSILILIAALGCMRKDIIKSMEDRVHENWMMLGKDLRVGDTARYCLADYTGGKKKLAHQCRKWIVTARDERTTTLNLRIENAPDALQGIERTYVVGDDGFIRQATAVSTKTGESIPIRIAGKLEGLSFERMVPESQFLSEDLEIIGKYTFRKDGKRRLLSSEYNQMEVVPVKVLFTPTDTHERIKYYLTSDAVPFGYVIEINVKKNRKDSDKDVLWANLLDPLGPPAAAPAP